MITLLKRMGKEKTHINKKLIVAVNKRDPTEENNLGNPNWVPVKDAVLTELGCSIKVKRLHLTANLMEEAREQVHARGG